VHTLYFLSLKIVVFFSFYFACFPLNLLFLPKNKGQHRRRSFANASFDDRLDALCFALLGFTKEGMKWDFKN